MGSTSRVSLSLLLSVSWSTLLVVVSICMLTLGPVLGQQQPPPVFTVVHLNCSSSPHLVVRPSSNTQYILHDPRCARQNSSGAMEEGGGFVSFNYSDSDGGVLSSSLDNVTIDIAGGTAPPTIYFAVGGTLRNITIRIANTAVPSLFSSTQSPPLSESGGPSDPDRMPPLVSILDTASLVQGFSLVMINVSITRIVGEFLHIGGSTQRNATITLINCSAHCILVDGVRTQETAIRFGSSEYFGLRVVISGCSWQIWSNNRTSMVATLGAVFMVDIFVQIVRVTTVILRLPDSGDATVVGRLVGVSAYRRNERVWIEVVDSVINGHCSGSDSVGDANDWDSVSLGGREYWNTTVVVRRMHLNLSCGTGSRLVTMRQVDVVRGLAIFLSFVDSSMWSNGPVATSSATGRNCNLVQLTNVNNTRDVLIDVQHVVQHCQLSPWRPGTTVHTTQPMISSRAATVLFNTISTCLSASILAFNVTHNVQLSESPASIPLARFFSAMMSLVHLYECRNMTGLQLSISESMIHCGPLLHLTAPLLSVPRSFLMMDTWGVLMGATIISNCIDCSIRVQSVHVIVRNLTMVDDEGISPPSSAAAPYDVPNDMACRSSIVVNLTGIVLAGDMTPLMNACAPLVAEQLDVNHGEHVNMTLDIESCVIHVSSQQATTTPPEPGFVQAAVYSPPSVVRALHIMVRNVSLVQAGITDSALFQQSVHFPLFNAPAPKEPTAIVVSSVVLIICGGSISNVTLTTTPGGASPSVSSDAESSPLLGVHGFQSILHRRELLPGNVRNMSMSLLGSRFVGVAPNVREDGLAEHAKVAVLPSALISLRATSVAGLRVLLSQSVVVGLTSLVEHRLDTTYDASSHVGSGCNTWNGRRTTANILKYYAGISDDDNASTETHDDVGVINIFVDGACVPSTRTVSVAHLTPPPLRFTLSPAVSMAAVGALAISGISAIAFPPTGGGAISGGAVRLQATLRVLKNARRCQNANDNDVVDPDDLYGTSYLDNPTQATVPSFSSSSSSGGSGEGGASTLHGVMDGTVLLYAGGTAWGNVVFMAAVGLIGSAFPFVWASLCRLCDGTRRRHNALPLVMDWRTTTHMLDGGVDHQAAVQRLLSHLTAKIPGSLATVYAILAQPTVGASVILVGLKQDISPVSLGCCTLLSVVGPVLYTSVKVSCQFPLVFLVRRRGKTASTKRTGRTSLSSRLLKDFISFVAGLFSEHGSWVRQRSSRGHSQQSALQSRFGNFFESFRGDGMRSAGSMRFPWYFLLDLWIPVVLGIFDGLPSIAPGAVGGYYYCAASLYGTLALVAAATCAVVIVRPYLSCYDNALAALDSVLSVTSMVLLVICSDLFAAAEEAAEVLMIVQTALVLVNQIIVATMHLRRVRVRARHAADKQKQLRSNSGAPRPKLAPRKRQLPARHIDHSMATSEMREERLQKLVRLICVEKRRSQYRGM